MPDAGNTVSLRESLADVLALAGRWGDVRTALEEALGCAPAEDETARSRLLSKTAHAWEAEHMHRDALDAY